MPALATLWVRLRASNDATNAMEFSMARMTRVVLLGAATLAWMMSAAVLTGCGSEASLEEKPQIEYTIAGQAKTSHKFFADTTGGQLTQQVKVLVRNSGRGPLKIESIKFKTQNDFMKMRFPKGNPSFPLTLAENESILVHVNFTPSPDIEDNRAGRMEITHNDEDFTSNPIQLTFSVQLAGARISLHTTSYTFINPSKHNPPEACFKFGNTGNAPLKYEDAQMGTATPYYAITKTPNAGDTIPALGDAGNPKNTPKTLEVCVRLKPESPDKDYGSSLVIKTSDKNNSAAKIVLNAKWEASNVFKFTSDHPKGELIYDFTGVTAGTKTRCVNVYNEGPAGFLINTVEVVAYNDKEQNAAKQQYVPELYKTDLKGDKVKVGLPFSVNASKSLDICMTFTYPTDGTEPIKARTLVTYVQANVADKVEFPILSGKCDTPQAVFAPASRPLWLRAEVGKSGTGKFFLANQSCAPLTIIKACVTQTAGVGIKDPCAQANIQSVHFKVKTNTGLKTIDPWGILPIEIEFAPPNEKFKNVHHLLNVTYCAGPFKANACGGGGTVNAVLNLDGYIGKNDKTEGVLSPTLKLAVAENQKATVGAPLKLEAIGKEGSYPIASSGGYLWMLSKRPKGSKLWLTSDFQVSNEPWMTIKPDAAGEYEITGAVQTFDTQTPSNLAWSDQVALTFKVAAASK